MVQPSSDTGMISARFATSAAELGFTPPPVALRLKFGKGPHHWTLFVQSIPPGPVAQIAEWLEPAGLLRLEFGTRNVLRADYDPIPPAWRDAFEGVDLDMLIARPDGTASVSVGGTRATLAAFSRRLQEESTPLNLRAIHPKNSDARFLTTGQDAALRAAVERGYYEIPRPINLRQLAAQLGISSAALSERLRRAEGRVLTRYVNQGGVSPWDETTLFDKRAFEPDTAWPPEIERVLEEGP
jgi:AraC-like DNA-binding protein